jgi:hypothetical protein
MMFARLLQLLHPFSVPRMPSCVDQWRLWQKRKEDALLSCCLAPNAMAPSLTVILDASLVSNPFSLDIHAPHTLLIHIHTSTGTPCDTLGSLWVACACFTSREKYPSPRIAFARPVRYDEDVEPLSACLLHQQTPLCLDGLVQGLVCLAACCRGAFTLWMRFLACLRTTLGTAGDDMPQSQPRQPRLPLPCLY